MCYIYSAGAEEVKFDGWCIVNWKQLKLGLVNRLGG